jgi:hypothetical protein
MFAPLTRRRADGARREREVWTPASCRVRVPQVRVRFLDANLGEATALSLRKRQLRIVNRTGRSVPLRLTYQQVNMLGHDQKVAERGG